MCAFCVQRQRQSDPIPDVANMASMRCYLSVCPSVGVCRRLSATVGVCWRLSASVGACPSVCLCVRGLVLAHLHVICCVTTYLWCAQVGVSTFCYIMSCHVVSRRVVSPRLASPRLASRRIVSCPDREARADGDRHQDGTVSARHAMVFCEDHCQYNNYYYC